MTDLKHLIDRAEVRLHYHETKLIETRALLNALKMSEAFEVELAYEGKGRTPSGISQVQMLNQSIHQTLRDLAAQDHGEIMVEAAVEALVSAGVSPTRAHARTTVHSTLSRSNDFVKVGRSHYRLRTGDEAVRPIAPDDLDGSDPF